MYQDDEWIIGVPETYEASSHFKKPVTNWCTAYPERYHGYLNEFGGNYYIHLNKHTGNLYQLHAESHQFKDASDTEIDKRDLITKYPQLRAFYDKIIPMDNPAYWSLHTNEPSKEDVIKAVEECFADWYEGVDVQGLLQYIANSKYEDLKDNPLVTKLVSTFYYPGSEIDYKDGNYIISVTDIGDFFGDTVDAVSVCERYLNGEEIFKYWDPNVYTIDTADNIQNNLTDEHGLDTQNLQALLDGNNETYTDVLIEDGYDESTATDLASKVQEYLENDFGDGLGARNFYDDCARNGAEGEFIKDFKNSFDSKYIVKESLDFDSGGLQYKIPSDVYLKFISDIPNLSELDEIDCDYIIQLLYGNYATRRIFSEPRYGWEGFDDEYWNDACKKFQEFLNELFDKNS